MVMTINMLMMIFIVLTYVYHGVDDHHGVDHYHETDN